MDAVKFFPQTFKYFTGVLRTQVDKLLSTMLEKKENFSAFMYLDFIRTTLLQMEQLFIVFSDNMKMFVGKFMIALEYMKTKVKFQTGQIL